MPILEFIKSLRAKIGTDLAAGAGRDGDGLIGRDGWLLLVRDKPSGLWGLPSGIIDPHELPADAAVRETWKEAGVFVELTHILGVFAGEHFSHVYDNGDRLAAVSTVFAARVIRGTPRPDGVETSDACFFMPAEDRALALLSAFQGHPQGHVLVPSQAYFKPATWQPDGH